MKRNALRGTWTLTALRPTDFKSLVSTYSTTKAKRVDTQGIEPWTCRLWVGCSDRWAKCPVIFFLSPGRNLISRVAGLSCWRGGEEEGTALSPTKSTIMSINLPCLSSLLATSPSLHDRLRLSSLVTVPSRIIHLIYYYSVPRAIVQRKAGRNFCFLFFLPTDVTEKLADNSAYAR